MHALQEGVAWSFEATSRSDDEYPSWFAEAKTFNIKSRTNHLSFLGPTDQHSLMEGLQRNG